ncbi:hypothetical protein [Pedobacter sp. MR2016-24]|uniref:hypothetical protein n=1 Tax=Pedobacter sp. MR2016-24 TaxID=2994466 RepID=UPI002247FE3C|nr:hypothetical protein [Pedobacter sp. MR2016-24]MCX2486263.1 hypothetical protein [Pedobacter sp. MR2016-24]
MKITRLSWAGLLLESPSTTLYIDPLQNVENMAPFLGLPKFGRSAGNQYPEIKRC